MRSKDNRRFFLSGFFLLIIGLTTGTNSLGKEVETAGNQAVVLKYFQEAREEFYNAANSSFSEALKKIKAGRELISSWSEGFNKQLWQAQWMFLEAQIVEAANNKTSAAAKFKESSLLAEKTLASNPNSSEANRLYADTIARQMNYNNFIFKIANGKKGYQLINTAIQLDKHNYTAYNSLAGYYINAPEAFGGSIPKSMEALEKAMESKDRFDNFISYVWLGQAYEKKKQPSKAVTYFQKALEIYPNNEWVKNFLQNLKTNR